MTPTNLETNIDFWEILANKLDSLTNPENSQSIMVWERIPLIWKNAPKENLVKVCKAENEICAELFLSKWIDFYAVLNEKVKNPV